MIEETRENFLLYSRDIVSYMGAHDANQRANLEKSMKVYDAAGSKALSEYIIVTHA
jgi:hypothetical protein